MKWNYDINHNIKIELNTKSQSWNIYHSKKIAPTILELKDWLEKHLPITNYSIRFISESGKIYQTTFIECFHVIAFLADDDTRNN